MVASAQTAGSAETSAADATRTAAPPADRFAACEARFAADPGDGKVCDCFYGVAIEHGLQAEAARRLTIHLEADAGNPCLHMNLGRLRRLAGDERAGEHLRVAAEGYARRGAIESEVYARVDLGRFLQPRDAGAAREALDAARRVAEAGDDPMLVAQVELEQARFELAAGSDLERIGQRLQRVEARVFPGGRPSLQRDTLQALGNVAYLLGRFAAAEGYYRRMAEVAAGSSDLYGEASARYAAVVAWLAQAPGPKRRAEAIALVRRAIDVSARAGQRFTEADGRLRLGKLVGGEAGRAELRRAVELARAIDARDLLAKALGALGAELVDDDPATARRLADEAFELARASPHFGTGAYGWWDRMTVVWATSPRAEALAESLEILDRVERDRDRHRAAGARAEYFAVWTEAYHALAGRLLAPPDGEPDLMTAFAVAERMRARVLLEALDAARALDPERAGTPPGFAGLAEIAAALAPDEALLSFLIAPWRDVYDDFAGGAWLLVTTRDGTRVHRLPGRDELAPRLQVFAHRLAYGERSAAAARRLHDELLGPALAALPPGIRRLVVVPDGILYRLPLAALAGADGAPLVARYALSIAPSATLWLRWRDRGPDARAFSETAGDAYAGDAYAEPAYAGRGALVFADPAQGSSSELETLPAARREGRTAVRLVGGRSRLLTGDDASERALATLDLTAFSILHFAAHAVVDADRPHRSAVLLAPGSDGDDGLLRPREIAALELDDAVVLLSACESAGGAVLRGEGPMSLARAFFEAGARSVVASQWPLHDNDAAELFGDLYRHLAAGLDVAAALAAAQRDAIAAGEPPSAWAGVVAYGDGNARPVAAAPPRRHRVALVLLLLALAAVAVALLRRARARR